MERYEAYKDSGVEWIGDIPKNWQLTKTLYGLSMPITDGPHETPILYAEGVPFVSAEAVSCGNGRIDFEHIRGFISEDYYNECCKKYKPALNDIYMIKSGASTGKVAIVDTDWVFTIWSPLAVFRCNNGRLFPKYLFYFLQSEGYQKQVEDSWSYGTQQNIGMRTLERLLVCYPSIKEQQVIADYLDAKTAEIDALVADCEREIGLLQEYRKAVITEAVTKGLDPDAPMKDSGVEWIGEIPEGWHTARLGEISYIRARLGWRALKAEEYVEEGYPMYSAFNIVNEKFVPEPVNYITEFRYLESPEIMMTVGDIMLVKDGAGVGKCAVIRELDGPCTVNGSIALITPEETQDSRYLYYFFESNAFQHFSRMLMGGMGVPHLFQRDIKLMRVIQPSLKEQSLIADYLDAKTAEIDALIDAKQSMAEKLREYRRSLISEAVTGKFKVPGV